jgi:hypothetical protein
MSVDYEDRYDFIFNRRVALAGGGTAWLTLCADLLSECEVGEVFALGDDGEEVRLVPEEYTRIEEYLHEVHRGWPGRAVPTKTGGIMTEPRTGTAAPVSTDAMPQRVF